MNSTINSFFKKRDSKANIKQERASPVCLSDNYTDDSVEITLTKEPNRRKAIKSANFNNL